MIQRINYKSIKYLGVHEYGIFYFVRKLMKPLFISEVF